MKKLCLISLLACLLLALTLTACGQGDIPDQTAPDTTAEAVTQAPAAEDTADDTADQATETVASTEESSEEQTTEAETEPETHYSKREDFDEDDPKNPYLNLIKVGTSYDGETPCYDGRYDFGFPVCTLNGVEFTCVQDAIDEAEALGGGIVKMIASTNVCLYLHIPEDGCFYRVNYNWYNVDFVMDHGAIYDDCKDKNGVHGYAYYSDLYKLDDYNNLYSTYVWVLSYLEGLTPGHYLITDEPSDDLYFFYGYEKTEQIMDWPGLPTGEQLPES